MFVGGKTQTSWLTRIRWRNFKNSLRTTDTNQRVAQSTETIVMSQLNEFTFTRAKIGNLVGVSISTFANGFNTAHQPHGPTWIVFYFDGKHHLALFSLLCEIAPQLCSGNWSLLLPFVVAAALHVKNRQVHFYATFPFSLENLLNGAERNEA